WSRLSPDATANLPSRDTRIERPHGAAGHRGDRLDSINPHVSASGALGSIGTIRGIIRAVPRCRAHDSDAAAPPGRPWVSRSLTATMPAAQVGATALVQPVFVAAVAVSDIAVPGELLSALHLLLAALGAVTVRSRLTAVPFMAA